MLARATTPLFCSRQDTTPFAAARRGSAVNRPQTFVADRTSDARAAVGFPLRARGRRDSPLLQAAKATMAARIRRQYDDGRGEIERPDDFALITVILPVQCQRTAPK
jgi:hypothetical protein